MMSNSKKKSGVVPATKSKPYLIDTQEIHKREFTIPDDTAPTKVISVLRLLELPAPAGAKYPIILRPGVRYTVATAMAAYLCGRNLACNLTPSKLTRCMNHIYQGVYSDLVA